MAQVDLDLRGDWDLVGNEGNFPRERGKRRKRSLSAQIIIKLGVVIYGRQPAPLVSTAPPVSAPPHRRAPRDPLMGEAVKPAGAAQHPSSALCPGDRAPLCSEP